MAPKMKLRKFTREDAERVAYLVGDYEVSRWTSNIPYPYSVDDATEWISSTSSGSGRHPWAVEVDGEIVACVSHWPHEAGATEIGYWVGREYWGNGICTKALELMLAEDSFPVDDRIVAKVMTDNIGSQRVLMKNGFSYCGSCNIHCRGTDLPSKLYEKWGR